MIKIRCFLFFLPMLFFTKSLNAQGNWAVGLHMGENFTSLTGDADSEYRLGFTAGAHASHYLLENLVLRLEVNFERKGAERILPPDPFVADVPAEIRLDYLTLPVLLRYSTGEKTKWIVGGGVAVSYLMKELTDFDGVVAVQMDDFRRVDTDLVACAGLGYPLNDKITLGFEVRGILGLLDVERNEGTAMQLGRNVAWGALVGINYYL